MAFFNWIIKNRIRNLPAPALILALVVIMGTLLTGCRKSEVLYLEQISTEQERHDHSYVETQAHPMLSGAEETGVGVSGAGEAGDGASPVREAGPHAEDAQPENQRTDGALMAPVTESEQQIAVFVCGAVKRPGVYKLPAWARGDDAVQAAGGFREDADTQWCNLASHLSDGQKLRIYTLEQTAQMLSEGMAEEGLFSADTAAAGDEAAAAGGPGAGTAEGTDAQGRINLNTATKEQLMTLPGIGEARAAAILSWRSEHGAFTDPEQIKQISGFKDAIYNNIKDLVSTG